MSGLRGLLQHDMFVILLFQVIARRQSSLPAADDDRFNLLNHLNSPPVAAPYTI